MYKIDEVVDGVVVALKERGFKDSTINNQRKNFYMPITRYHYKKGDGKYSEEILSDYYESEKIRLAQGEIKYKHFTALRTAIHRLNSYVKVGKVDFSIISNTKKYDPGSDYYNVIEQILSDTDLTSDRKKEMHICMRHFFCFIGSHHNSLNQIVNSDFTDFIIEASQTNKRSMNRVT